MGLLAVQTQGAQLTVAAGALVVFHKRRKLLTRPVHEVDEVHLYGHVELSAAARDVLLQAGIETLLLTPGGKLRGRIVGPLSSAANRRVAQYAALIDPERALQLARGVVRAKLSNQRQLLVRIRRSTPGRASPEAIVGLRQLLRRVDQIDSVDVLRGIEGHGAALYFRGLGRAVLHEDMAFERRSRRPPRDPFNACLSFGYTLLFSRVDAAVRRVGLDPYLGALHTADRGKPALSLDVVEPYRVLIDRIVLRLVNRRQLTPNEFINPEVEIADASDPEPTKPRGPAVHLGPLGRPIFLRALGALWRNPVDGLTADRRISLTDLIQEQGYELAKWLKGETETLRYFRLR